MLETLDTNAVSDVHSGGVVIDGAALGAGLADDALRKELARFGVVRSIRKRSGTRVSVYYKGSGALKSNSTLFEKAHQLEQTVLNGRGRGGSGRGAGAGGAGAGAGANGDDEAEKEVLAQVLLFPTAVLDQDMELVRQEGYLCTRSLEAQTSAPSLNPKTRHHPLPQSRFKANANPNPAAR